MEHRKVMERCNAVLDEYRTIERKLRPHIVKSRPYYEERWRSSQRLNVCYYNNDDTIVFEVYLSIV